MVRAHHYHEAIELNWTHALKLLAGCGIAYLGWHVIRAICTPNDHVTTTKVTNARKAIDGNNERNNSSMHQRGELRRRHRDKEVDIEKGENTPQKLFPSRNQDVEIGRWRFNQQSPALLAKRFKEDSPSRHNTPMLGDAYVGRHQTRNAKNIDNISNMYNHANGLPLSYLNDPLSPLNNSPSPISSDGGYAPSSDSPFSFNDDPQDE